MFKNSQEDYVSHISMHPKLRYKKRKSNVEKDSDDPNFVKWVPYEERVRHHTIQDLSKTDYRLSRSNSQEYDGQCKKLDLELLSALDILETMHKTF